MDQADRDELGAFLRRRREQIQPEEVGLEPGGRRRTPGLRRQEVAQLAAMSIDYYIQLEQGRGPRPSAEMITSISRALRLADDERGYVSRLVGVEPRPPDWISRDVRPGLLFVLDQLEDAPAMVCDAKYDLLAWNPMAAALLPDLVALPAAERNVVRRYFADDGDGSRDPDPDHESTFAGELVAGLRVAAARYRSDPGLRDLIARLQADSVHFRRLWAAQNVAVGLSTTKRINHPSIGWIELDCEALHDPGRDQWVIIYTARPGTPAREALRLLKVIGTQELAVPDGGSGPDRA